MPDMDELIEIAIAAADNINDMDVSLDALIAAAVRAVVPVVLDDVRDKVSRLKVTTEDAGRIVTALATKGLVVVPMIPTNRMCAAGGPEVRKACGLGAGKGDMHTIWTAMIAARP